MFCIRWWWMMSHNFTMWCISCANIGNWRDHRWCTWRWGVSTNSCKQCVSWLLHSSQQSRRNRSSKDVNTRSRWTIVIASSSSRGNYIHFLTISTVLIKVHTRRMRISQSLIIERFGECICDIQSVEPLWLPIKIRQSI